MNRLEDKVAVITGGANGIGLATGLFFHEEGAKVLLVDVDQDALEKAVEDKAPTISHITADVSKEADVKKYIQTAVDRYGGIDILINNAGIFGEANPITEYAIEVFDRLMAINVRGMWLGCKFAIPEMLKRGGGSIVITSSTAGVVGSLGGSPYSMSKHAIIGAAKSLALEWAPSNIRVNTINPTAVETSMMRQLEQSAGPDMEEMIKQKMIDLIPMKRYAEPDEIAKVMLFLAGDDSRFCTGGSYLVDGGYTAQ